jgi:hypothetical protein
MKTTVILSVCALLGALAGYFCAPLVSVGVFQSNDPEMFYGSILALVKSSVVCDCARRPPDESAKSVSKYLSTLQTAKAKNQSSRMLSQEIGLTYVRLSMVEEKLNQQSQADSHLEQGEKELASIGWRDVTSDHLKSLVTQLDSEYQRADDKGKPSSNPGTAQ